MGTKALGSVSLTHGFRVSVVPRFLPEQSSADRWVFAYRITITNQGDRAARLMSRYWRVIDADGEVREVRGLGVVGEQPRLEPGESHTYASFCPLETPWGTMEGRYTMQPDEGESFEIEVGRFYLAAPSPDATSDAQGGPGDRAAE